MPVVREQVSGVLAIVGTRTLACPQDPTVAGRLAADAIGALRPDVVITGAARGTDRLAAAAARWLGYRQADGTLRIYEPASYAWPDLRERDGRLAEDCTCLVRLHCRQATTYGSGWTADEAGRLGKPVRQILVCDIGKTVIGPDGGMWIFGSTGWRGPYWWDGTDWLDHPPDPGVVEAERILRRADAERRRS